MIATLVVESLPTITSDHLGAMKPSTASRTSDGPFKVTSIASRQDYTDESLMNVWVMIGTIVGCLTVMIAVTIAYATSMS